MPIVVGWLGAMVASGAVSAVVGALTLASARGLSRDHDLRRRRRRAARRAQRAEADRRGIRHRASSRAPSTAWRRRLRSMNLANLASSRLVVVVVYVGARAARAQSLGPRVARDPRGRDAPPWRSARTPVALPSAGLRAGRRCSWASPARSRRISSASSRPENYTSILTFQVWAMLIVGGSGNNLGAIARRRARLGALERFRPRHRRSRPGVVRGARRGVAPHGDRRLARDNDRRSPARSHRRESDGLAPSRQGLSRHQPSAAVRPARARGVSAALPTPVEFERKVGLA